MSGPIFSRFLSLALCIPVAAIFVGCASAPLVQEKDRGPNQPVDVSHIPEPVPREELRTAAGNTSPYRVLGRTYRVLETPDGYRERGIASWYGMKFHGRRTANGELYDMYGMTAAHKTLPIPSYVRVTNLANNKSIIVRVNDRGPFHDDRIIDLTYTGAKRLGFEKSGTTEVTVEYIDPRQYAASVDGVAKKDVSAIPAATGEPPAPTPSNAAGYALPDNTFLQVGAFSRESSARAFKDKVDRMTTINVRVVPPKRRKKQSLYKVHVGPFLDNLELLSFRKKLMEANLPSPHVVYP